MDLRRQPHFRLFPIPISPCFPDKWPFFSLFRHCSRFLTSPQFLSFRSRVCFPSRYWGPDLRPQTFFPCPLRYFLSVKKPCCVWSPHSFPSPLASSRCVGPPRVRIDMCAGVTTVLRQCFVLSPFSLSLMSYFSPTHHARTSPCSPT